MRVIRIEIHIQSVHGGRICHEPRVEQIVFVYKIQFALLQFRIDVLMKRKVVHVPFLVEDIVAQMLERFHCA